MTADVCLWNGTYNKMASIGIIDTPRYCISVGLFAYNVIYFVQMTHLVLSCQYQTQVGQTTSMPHLWTWVRHALQLLAIIIAYLCAQKWRTAIYTACLMVMIFVVTCICGGSMQWCWLLIMMNVSTLWLHRQLQDSNSIGYRCIEIGYHCYFHSNLFLLLKQHNIKQVDRQPLTYNCIYIYKCTCLIHTVIYIYIWTLLRYAIYI